MHSWLVCDVIVQGVRLEGHSQPLLQQLGSIAAGKPSWNELDSSTMQINVLTVPT